MDALNKIKEGIDTIAYVESKSVHPVLWNLTKRHLVPWDYQFRRWIQEVVLLENREALFKAYFSTPHYSAVYYDIEDFMLYGWTIFQEKSRKRSRFMAVPNMRTPYAMLLEQYHLANGAREGASVMCAFAWLLDTVRANRWTAKYCYKYWSEFEKKCRDSRTPLETFNKIGRFYIMNSWRDHESN
eukprot:3853138-Rhodomonas_salina.3